MSFRTRLVLAAAYLLGAVVLALVIPLTLNVERRADSDFEAAVLGEAAILAARIADLVAAADARPPARPPVRLAAIVRESTRTPERRVVVTDRAGRVLVDSAGIARRDSLYATLERPEFGTALFRGQIDSRRRFSDSLGEELLLVTIPVVDRERVVGAVRVSASRADIEAGIRASRLRLALIGLAVIAAGLALAWLLVAPLGRRVHRLAEASARLGRGELDARAPEQGPKELDVLARSFNQMATALTGNIEAQREFLANASHQLKTPLTGLRLRLEAIQEEGGWTGEQAAEAQAELDRLSTLVDDLLALARASSVEASSGSLDLADLAREAAARWREPAEASGKRLELEARAGAHVRGNREDLAHVLDNLIDNALRYAPPGTEVRLETDTRDGRASLTVADSGAGIPPQDRLHIFERFYRGANGRQAGPGTGLGLAIVAELVHRWDGDVRLLEGPGTRIQAAFPHFPSER